jgi:hypothetical protein
MAVFWDVALCSLVEIFRRCGVAYCPHYDGDETPQELSLKRRSVCTTVCSDTSEKTFFTALMMDAVRRCEMSVTVDQTTRRNNPEGNYFHKRSHL